MIEKIIKEFEEKNDIKLKDYRLFSEYSDLSFYSQQEDFVLTEYIKDFKMINRFANFYFDFERILKDFKDYEFSFPKENKNIILEFSCPNPGKPMHFGHLRSTILGFGLYKLLKLFGNNVIRVNYMNDRGRHIGILIAGLLKENKIDDLLNNKMSDRDLLAVYVKYQDLLSDDEINDIIKRIDERDDYVISILDKIYEISVKSFEEVYRYFNIEFDKYLRESSIKEEEIREVLDVLENKGLIKKADVIRLNIEGEPPLFRSNNTRLYLMSDIIIAYRRLKEGFIPYYVVANEQQLHFEYLNKVMNILFNKNIVFVGFGLMKLEGGESFSSRKGRVLFIEDVINDFKNYLKSEGKDLHDSLIKSGIIFEILKREKNREIILNKKEMFNYKGRTGVYLLYNYVRALSLLRDYKNKKPLGDFVLTDKDKELLKQLLLFELVIKDAYRKLDLYVVANYLFDLSKAFSEFYESEKILNTEKESYKMVLVELYKRVMDLGLDLLNIERMERI